MNFRLTLYETYCMHITSQLQLLLDLDIPFAILFSNSYLGPDSFMIVLASDCSRHGLGWEESYSQPLLKEQALNAADQAVFNELRQTGLLRSQLLGKYGMAYELSGLPFRPYYQRALSEQLVGVPG